MNSLTSVSPAVYSLTSVSSSKSNVVSLEVHPTFNIHITNAVKNNKHLYLEVVEVCITEERRQTEVPVQTQNGRRRFKKNWIKTGKRLESIGTIHRFKTKGDWLKLLPPSKEFTVKECREELLQKGLSLTQEQVSLMLWVYAHAGFLSRTKTGRAYLYHKQ